MRLGDASFLLKELRNKQLTSSRLIFPSELRTDIGAALGPLLDEFAWHSLASASRWPHQRLSSRSARQILRAGWPRFSSSTISAI
ncbi:MAG: hypothetical protein IPH72_34525 [Sandaracinaceae bacterium]|nr:hypothetical protein [Sandaracinaceae bacterium]